MYYINMILGKGKTVTIFSTQASYIIEILDLETGLAQTIGKVVAVEASVVVLSEDAGALLGVGNRVVFVGRITRQIHGREQNAPTPFFEDAVQLAHRLQIVLDVLHQVVADNNIERFV